MKAIRPRHLADDRVRVWAPLATQVELVRGDQREAMQSAGDGWFRGPVLAHGERYAFSLDGQAAIPDPRSRSQPDGVHAASQWFTTITPAQPCTRHVPLADALIYELHLGTFSVEGTYRGAIAHLDHLVELRVTHVELLPLAQFPGVHGWGYDGVYPFAAHAGYGTLEDLVALIDACHARGLAVIVDVVHNHFGPEGNYTGQFAPYRTSSIATPWGDAINLDGEHSAEVRRYFIDSALAWLVDVGCDGLRLDAVHSLHDRSARHFIAELMDAVHAAQAELGRPLVIVGEYDDHDPHAVTERPVGWGLDAHWNDDFHHAVHALVTDEHAGYYQDFAAPEILPKLLEQGYALDGGHSAFRGAAHGKPFGELPRDRLIAYIQSHDQTGNRAAGERLHQLTSHARTRIAAAILFASPFVPMLFQGEEWAASSPFCFFCDFTDENLRRAVRDGRAREHAAAHVEGFDPVSPKTRDRCVLAWDERAQPAHAEMLAWYRALARLRADVRALRDPSPAATRATFAHGVLSIERCKQVVLTCNLGARAVPLPEGEILLASSAIAHELPAESCVFVRRYG